MSLKTPLISSIELLSMVDQDNISRQVVANNYRLFMKNGGTINPEELIEILGGTDGIIQHYLSELNPIKLNSDQLQSINNMFKSQSNANIWDDLKPTQLLISKHDTFFQHLLGIEMGNKIYRFVFSHIIVGFYSILGITGAILYLLHLMRLRLSVLLQKFCFWLYVKYLCHSFMKIWSFEVSQAIDYLKQLTAYLHMLCYLLHVYFLLGLQVTLHFLHILGFIALMRIC